MIKRLIDFSEEAPDMILLSSVWNPEFESVYGSWSKLL